VSPGFPKTIKPGWGYEQFRPSDKLKRACVHILDDCLSEILASNSYFAGGHPDTVYDLDAFNREIALSRSHGVAGEIKRVFMPRKWCTSSRQACPKLFMASYCIANLIEDQRIMIPEPQLESQRAAKVSSETFAEQGGEFVDVRFDNMEADHNIFDPACPIRRVG
jgi:hypothetical protein